MAHIRRPFRVRHHAKDAAVFRQDTGNVAQGPVGVVGIGECDAILARQLIQRGLIREIVAIVMRNRDIDDVTRIVPFGVGRLRRLHLQTHGLADVFQACIAQERAGQDAGFGQNLKSVAHAQHIAAPIRMGLYGLTNWGIGRNRTATQVVTKGKAARHADDINAFGQARILVPYHRDIRTRRLERHRQIPITVRAGKNDHGSLHDMSTR
mmetsp:Transcript_18163/g.28382  ORF Transcript_18163/g.28382 Transcript_18163/m.28382 type:complete len:209 (-) Transcript_18163:254-880(-)